MTFTLTKKEILLAVAFAIMGFAFSTRQWILYLDTQTPINGLIIYYVVLYISLYMLSRAGLIIYNFVIDTPTKTLGLIMVTFAFFILVDWTSPYVQYVTGRKPEDVSPIFYQDEDGATYSFWNTIIKVNDINQLRILTFVVTPFLLTLLGGLLVEGRIHL